MFLIILKGTMSEWKGGRMKMNQFFKQCTVVTVPFITSNALQGCSKVMCPLHPVIVSAASPVGASHS